MSVELTPEALFEIVLEEALRDGNVEDGEFEKVEQVKELLGITAEQHRNAFKKVKARVDAAPESDRGMDRVLIYQKCLIVAAADGKITEDETEKLNTMKEFLSITPEEHKASMIKVKQWLAEKRATQK